MELVPAVVCALIGLAAGFGVPRLIAWCPEPEHNPDENPDDFPDHVRFVELARRPGLGWRSAVGCAVAAGVLGAAIGWGWGLTWLVLLVPLCCALTVIDYVTWYLPSRLIWTGYGAVAVLEIAATIALRDAGVVLWAAIGFVALGLYYGLLWFISPRVMAFGDVRLGALIGLALGPFGPAHLVLSVLGAAVISVLALIPLQVGGTMIKRRVPYGPFLAAGAVLAVVLGRVLGTG